MGGELILHILTEGESVCSTAKELILQPQSEIHKVREYLRQHQYKIEDEDMVCEEGKYYPMMRAVKTEQDETWNRLNDQTIAVCDIYTASSEKRKSGTAPVFGASAWTADTDSADA